MKAEQSFGFTPSSSHARELLVTSRVSEASRSTVLIVDDDAAIRRLVKMVLERRGFTVDIAADGIEAVLKLGIAEYAAIVLDLMMPNLDGFAFMQTLAENDPARLRRIVVMSAAAPTTIEGRLTASPFALLPKPFDIEKLAATVRACAEQEGKA